MRRFILLALLLLVPATALTSTVILTDDSYVSARQSNRNFNSGHDPSLEVSSDATSLLRFDFAALPAGTSSHLVLKATLVVFVKDLGGAGSFDLLRLQAPWNEETVTGSTAPAGAPEVTGIPISAESKFVAIDVTTAVRDWLDGEPNYGFAIRPTAGSGLEMALDSKESIGTGHEARIDIALCGAGSTFYRDADGDGYGDASVSTVACSAPTGHVSRAGDCDDSNAAINPDAAETCNGSDDNCNGTADEGVGSTFYRDADGDGFGTAADSLQACSAPAGYVAQAGDCNDANAAVNPAAAEICNGTDDNCNAQIDETGGTIFFRDADADGFGSATHTISACSPPPGYVPQAGDCNDANPSVHPGAQEICNGIDDDCDGGNDEGAVSLCPARPNAQTVCTSGACTYICAPGFVDCNGNATDGCETNLAFGPACGSAVAAGTFPGDTGSGIVVRNGVGDAVYSFTVREDNAISCEDTKALFELVVPPGVNYDLTVRCSSCGGPPLTSSNGPGVMDRVSAVNDESCVFGVGDGTDQTFTAVVEVRWVSGQSCAPWELRARFNQSPVAPVANCN